MNRLYETDYTAWADQTAQLLLKRRFDEIDLEALIEEVTSLKASAAPIGHFCGLSLNIFLS